MANIRINSLPATTTVLPDDVLPMDGASTRKIAPADLVNSVRPISTQSQAEAGTDNTTSMTPLGTAQAIASKLPNTAAGRAMLNAATPAAQRTLLTLGDAALANVGSSAGTVAAGDDIRFAGVAGIVDQATAEAGTNNTGIMSPLRVTQHLAAHTGTTAGTVAAGNDSRFGTVPDGYVTDAKVASTAAIDLSKISYDRGVTGSIRKAYSLIVGPDTVNAREFVNCDGTDETTKLQNAFNAAKNKRLILPAGNIRCTGVTLDPTVNFDIQGVGCDPSGLEASCIENIGTSGQVGINLNCGPTFIGADNYRRLAGFTIKGNQNSGDGIQTTGAVKLYLEELWATTHGRHGIYLYRSFSNKLHKVTSTQNGKWGLYCQEIANALTIQDCIINTNGRKNNAGNINIEGAAAQENLGVNISGTDFTGAGKNGDWNGGSITGATGLMVSHTWSLVLNNASYAEKVGAGAAGRLIYMGPTVRAVSVMGCYFQDGIVQFDGVPELFCVANSFYGVEAGVTTQLMVQNSGTDQQHVRQNVLKGTATQALTGLIAPKETYGTTPPASGTWTVGDKRWYNTPYPGGPIGWVCTTAGTPGTWKEFGAVAS